MASFNRLHIVPIENVSIGTAVQDIFSVKTTAAIGMSLYQIHLEAGGVSAVSEIRLRLKRGVGTLGGSTGGSLVAAPPLESMNTIAASCVCRINDTTQATATTFTTLAGGQFNVLGAWDFFPIPETRPSLAQSQILVLDLPAAIAAAVTISGYLIFEEFP